jgi:hypothetical protein
MKPLPRRFVIGLIALMLFAAGCDHKAAQTEQPPARAQSSQPVEVPSQPARPHLEIAGDPVFSVPDDELLSYSEGWRTVLADAEAHAASFGSDEMKAQARNEVLARADKSALQAEAQANIRQLRLAYLQQHPNAAVVLGFYSVSYGWAHNRLNVGCPPEGLLLVHSSCRSGVILAVHLKYKEMDVGVTATEMDSALTQILKDHESEFNRDQELEAKNFLDQTGVADDREDIVKRAKDDIYPSYLACAVVGDFRAELVDNEEPTPESLSRQTRKAYLVDSSNGNILAELSNPWGHLHPQQ